MALNIQDGPVIRRKVHIAASGGVSDPVAMTEAQDVWVDFKPGGAYEFSMGGSTTTGANLPNTTAVYYDKQVVSQAMTDILKDSTYNWKWEKEKSKTLDVKSAVNFTRSTTTATSYNAGTIKT